MRLIDANKVVKDIIFERDNIPYELISEKPFKHGNSMRGGIRKALRCIEQAPTIDAVPVVRCRECKHCNPTIFNRNFIGFCEIRKDSYGAKLRVGLSDYCSYGERKEGAD